MECVLSWPGLFLPFSSFFFWWLGSAGGCPLFCFLFVLFLLLFLGSLGLLLLAFAVGGCFCLLPRCLAGCLWFAWLGASVILLPFKKKN